MIDRLALYINFLGISVRAFELNISASNGLIRKAIANGTDIQSKWLSVIVDNYPQLDVYWLLTGKGEMIKGDSVIFFPPKKTAPQTPPEPSIIYRDNPEKDEIIQLQREQIQLLKEKLEDFKKDHIGYVRSTPIPPVAAPASAKVDPLVKVSNLGADQPSKQP